MKDNHLAGNIQEARQHIRRLKREADLIQTSFQQSSDNTKKPDDSFSLNQYFSNALYSLAKNQGQIDSKVEEYKNSRLPAINKKNNQKDQAYYLKGYRKKTRQEGKKANQSISKGKVNSFSTRADDSLSIVLENRKVKIHSHHQKLKVGEVYSETNLGSNLNFESLIAPENFAPQKQSSAHSSIRSRKRQQVMKKINLNDSIMIRDASQDKSLSQRLREQKAMQYESVVDNFSSHIFMLINGNAAVQSPEFVSYQRIYKSIFPRIQREIKALESLVKEFGISYTRFDGKKLAYLCLKETIKRQELIDCLIQGRGEILSKLPETKYKGEEGKLRAVNKIIAFWKMKNLRRKYLILRENTIVLQRFFQRKKLQLDLERKVIKRNQEMVSRFEERQSHLEKVYKKIKTSKRIQIHLNSIQIDQEKRLTIQNFSERQNIQLPRIFSLKDPNLILIYVSSKEVSHELINYYYKILELSNIENFKDRLFFISPRDYKFPEHFSTTKLLYYCSRTLNQLKQITEGMPTILHAGNPCNELIKICDFLNCYLFSGEPNKMRQFMTKSQTKRLLKNLCIETLPGSMQMYDYGEFLNTFSVLILKNPEIPTWILKIDDQFGGRGIAYLELWKSKVLQSLLKKVQYKDQNNFFATDIISQPVNQQITIKIRDYLKEKLPHKLVIATPTLYRSYEEFMGRFIKKGGIIEAHPPCSKDCLTFPSVSFCLDPDGQLNILCTYEKLSSQPYRNVACSFPQRSLQYDQIMSLCRQLVESFKIRKLFGHFTVDLICYQKEDQFKYWVLDIEPFLNDYSCSFYLFNALMEGSYIQDENVYLTEVVSENESDPKRSLEKSLLDSHEKAQSNLQAREYIFVPHFLNKDFRKTNIKEFFKQARIEQFNFDIGQKVGVCMLLFDELTSGEMGLMTVADSKEGCVEKFEKVFKFIAKTTTVKNNSYGKSQIEPCTDALTISEVMSKFLSLERREKRISSKKKAHEQFKNSQNLQLI